MDGGARDSMDIKVNTADAFLATVISDHDDVESDLQHILDDIDTPGYMTNAQGFVTHYNEACIDFFGRTPSVGRDRWHVAWKLFTADGDYLPHEKSAMAEAIKQGKPMRGLTMIAARPNGQRVRFAPFPTPYFDPAGHLVGAVNILVGVSDVLQISELQAQAACCRHMRFGVSDERCRTTLGQSAAQYEAKIADQARAGRSLANQHKATYLSDVLYANSSALVLEREWADLIHSVAAGDELSLHSLYARTHDLVSTLLLKITNNADATKHVVAQVFEDIRQHASHYDVGSDSGLGWVLIHARRRGLNTMSAAIQNTGTDANGATSDSQDRVMMQTASLRLGLRIVTDATPPAKASEWREPDWESVATGIECKLLANDPLRHRVSMLVRLAPGASYPAHTHAGAEELHLLDGELWIDDSKLNPGDYNYGAPGAGDKRVWSETGCTCVLMTSTQDVLH
jgi:hypothetical protein